MAEKLKILWREARLYVIPTLLLTFFFLGVKWEAAYWERQVSSMEQIYQEDMDECQMSVDTLIAQCNQIFKEQHEKELKAWDAYAEACGAGELIARR